MLGQPIWKHLQEEYDNEINYINPGETLQIYQAPPNTVHTF